VRRARDAEVAADGHARYRLYPDLTPARPRSHAARPVPPRHVQVANAAGAAEKRHPKPVGGGVTIDTTQTAPGGGKKGRKEAGQGNKEDDAL
jgi:hypothetical protein